MVSEFSYRWSDAIKNCKKGLKVCSQKDPTILGELLHCYAKLIEIYVEMERYDEAIKTYDKIKMYNLNSNNAEDVQSEVSKVCSQAIIFYHTLQVGRYSPGRKYRHPTKELLSKVAFFRGAWP